MSWRGESNHQIELLSPNSTHSVLTGSEYLTHIGAPYLTRPGERFKYVTSLRIIMQLSDNLSIPVQPYILAQFRAVTCPL